MFERFVFDNIACNEYGVMCVSFDQSLPSKMSAHESELNTEKSIMGDTYHIISQPYSTPLTQCKLLIGTSLLLHNIKNVH